MGRSQETFNKKEVRKKKEKKRKEKEARRQARKATENNSGLDDMIAYVDEFGNITSTPPEENRKTDVKLEDIEVSVPKGSFKDKESTVKNGIVAFFNEQKGYGFIRNLENDDKVFVHINNIEGTVTEGTRVTFEVERGERGLAAANVKVAE
jgi:cold shock CspA family protein